MKQLRKPTVLLSTVAISLLALNQLTFLGGGQTSSALASSKRKQAKMKHNHEKKLIDGKTFIISRTTVKASPERVFDVLTDYDNATKIFSNLKSCEVVKSSGNEKLVKFTAKAAGLVNFDYILSINETEPSRIEWKRHSGAFKANEGYWQLDPRHGGKSTMVTYAKHVDAGGFIPKSMVLKTVSDTVPIIFAELARAAETTVVGALTQPLIKVSR